MKQKGYSLIELMVGLTVSLFLIAAMTAFIGSAGYDFQNHKNNVVDRNLLKRSLHMLSSDLIGIGVNADGNGMIVDGSQAKFYIDISNSGPNNSTVLEYYEIDQDMDYIASQQENKVYSYSKMTYKINAAKTHPTTGQNISVLEQIVDGLATPFIIGVVDFSVTLGVDLNEDGLIEEADGEWISNPPVTDEEKMNIYGKLAKLRVRVSNQTDVIDGDPVVHTVTQEIFLRNRGGE